MQGKWQRKLMIGRGVAFIIAILLYLMMRLSSHALSHNELLSCA
jgi:hypothetical protein